MKILLAFAFSAGLVGCFLVGKTVKLNEEFTLKKNETAKVEKTNLNLKMLGNGHNTLVGGGHTYFCQFEVGFNGETGERELSVGQSVAVENLSIKLLAIDETANSKEKDPWSNTSCRFIVTKNAE